MPITFLEKAVGYSVGRKKLSFVVAAITGTGNINVGLKSIEAAVVSVQNSGATIATTTASCTATTAPNVSVVCTEHQAGANAVSGAAKNVAVIAIGE